MSARALVELAGACWLGAFAAGCAPGPGDVARAFDPDTVTEAYARPTGALYLPGASRAFLVTPDGDLTNGDWRVRIAVGATPSPPRVIAAESRWLPVLHWNRVSGPVRYEFEAVAVPVGSARDSGLVVSLRVVAINTGSAPESARVELALEPRGRASEFVAPDAPESVSTYTWAGAGSAEPACGWAEGDGADEPGHRAWSLAPGARAVARFLLPAYPERADVLAALARTPHERQAAHARSDWSRQVDAGARFELGDPELERAIAAARVVLLGCRERRGAAWVPIGNPFQYRDVWVRDGARVVRALAVSGYESVARELAEGLLLSRWPNGAFLSQRGQLDGTGQVLWALDEAFARGRVDADAWPRVAGPVQDACGWLRAQYRVGANAGWEFGAELPFGDPRDGELARAQLVGNDAWRIAGLRAGADLLRRAGRAAEADSAAAWLVACRAAFERDLERTASGDVPPSWQGVGRDWGNFSVAVPCGALALEHPRMVALAGREVAAAGGPGLGWYGEPDSLHTYIAADLATWAALTGRGEMADRMLDSLLAWRTASGGFSEYFSRRTRDFGTNLPPHTTAAAALLSMVRDRLVYDDGDTLVLTARTRPAWWRRGRVSRAPTRFGTIDLAFASDGAHARWRWTAVRAWTALTLPPGTRPHLPLAPPLVAGARADVVLVPPGTTSVDVLLESRGSR